MKYVAVGRILSTHGLKGEVSFRYYNKEERERFKSYKNFFIFEAEGPIQLKARSIREKKDLFIIKFEGIEKIEEVERFVGKELFVSELELPPLEPGEFYLYELEGLFVYNEKDELIGKVEGVLEKKGVPVLVVSGKREIYVPLVEDFIISIEIEKKSMKIKEELLMV